MKPTSYRLSLLAALLVTVPLAAPPLAAQAEREDTTPTAAVWLTGVSAATINLVINQGYRITDLEVDNASASSFTVAMMHNSGAYAVAGWWWYYGITSSQVSAYLAQNNARPIDLETYVDGGGTRRYAVVMVSNTGAAHKAYGIFYGSSSATISNFVSANNHRIVDLNSYDSGGSRVYAAITWPNTGSDARSWWWYYGVTPAQVSAFLSQNNARLVDLGRNPSGTYDVVMTRVSGKWWYYYGQSAAQVTARAKQIGARVVDIERRGADLFDVILTNNVNALTTRISEILRTGTDGFLGAYLRRVDNASGATLAALHADTTFEPASTMKTLHHVHAMRRVSIGTALLGQGMVTYLGMNGSCPTGGAPFVGETLEMTLRAMMENSDNARTKTIADFFGVPAINATAAALGMSDTSLNHTLGCGGPTPNEITLVDLGRLHRQVATGYLGSQRDKFYELMINSRTYPSSGGTSIMAIVDAEAASVGITGSLLDTFKGYVAHAAKGGNYDWSGIPRFQGSYFGFVSLPFCSNGQVIAREYAVGTFFNDATVKAPAFAAIATAYCELLRDEIHAALTSWVGAQFGSLAYFGAGCAGSNGVPLATASGAPQVGETVTYSVSSGPVGLPGVLYLGGSKTWWNRLPLPFSLGALQAPGCNVLTDPLVPIGLQTNRSGAASVPLTLPLSGALVGETFHAQFYLVDPPANGLGLIVSRGITTTIGKNLP